MVTNIIIFSLCILSATLFVNGSDSQKPLILTPLINQGKFEEARIAAEVNFSEFHNVKSYAGYFTVNKNFNSNLFFWFFPSQFDYAKAPVMLWLEGGPGTSTLLDVLLGGNNPFDISSGLNLEMGKYAWIRNHSIIYVDSPVGTGYSFTDEGGYVQNETIIGAHLYEALLQFFQVFPELQKNNFFVGGVSYAGKYVPAVSYTIYKNNPLTQQQINLQGLIIGNGWSDPEHQTGYSDYLYQVGLIDSANSKKMKKMENDLVAYIQQEEWQSAFEKFTAILINNQSFYQIVTGFENFHNYLTEKMDLHVLEIFNKYIQREDFRSALHVGNTSYHLSSVKVRTLLEKDVLQSVAPWISELLSHYKILFYNGQLDVICAYPLTVAFIKKLNFSGAEVYKTALRHKWYVDTDLAGYVKEAGNLTEILVRNASHAVHVDQPKWTLDLITRFTRGIPFH